MIFLFENFAESRLEGGALPTDLVLSIPAKDSNKFPSPASELQRFALVLYDGIQDPEICWATLNSGTGNIVVERGQEDTAPKHWRPGTAVINAPTKVSLDYLASGGSDSWHQELQLQIDQAFARITAETQARIDQAGAFASQLQSIETGMVDTNAQVSTLSQAFAGISNAWAAYQIQVDAQAADAVAKATQALNTSVTTETAVATLKTEVEAAIGPDGAVFAEKIQALVDFDTAQVGINTDLETRFDGAEASLTEEILLRSNQYLAQAEINSTLTADVGDNTARIAAEEAARADETQALAQRSSALEAEVEAGRGGAASLAARITGVETAAATATSALATRTDELEAEVSDATGVIGQAVVTTTQNAAAAATSAGAALAAQTQTATSANTALAAKAAMLPPRLDTDGSNFTAAANGAATTVTGLTEAQTETVPAFGLVAKGTTAGAALYNRGLMAFKPGRVYRVIARVELIGTGVQNGRLYVRGQNGAYATTDNQTSDWSPLTPGVVTELTLLYGNPAPPGGKTLGGATVFSRAGAMAQAFSAGGYLRIYEIYHEDITESTVASTAASTALTQSSQATASAAEAKIQADIATGVGASVPGALIDPTFQIWPAGDPRPSNVSAVTGNLAISRQTVNFIYGDKALRLNDSSASYVASFITIPAASFGPATADADWVCEYEITLNSGNLKKIGFQFRSNRTTGYYGATLDLAGQHLNTVPGQTIRGAKLFTPTATASPSGVPTTIQAWFYTNLSTFAGDTFSAKNLTLHMLQFRPARPEEIARGVATPSIAAGVKIVAGAVSDLAARVGEAFFKVSGGAGGDPFLIEMSGGSGASSADMAASKIRLKNVINGELVDALVLQNGNAVLKGNLTAGSGIYLGSGVLWAVALRAQTFVRGDGETISFGGANIGIPTYEFVQDNLLPLGVNERYDLQLKSLTAAGGTVWAKIIVPGTPTAQTIAAPGTVPGSGPTRQLVKSPKPDSENGTYTLSVGGSYTFTVLKYTEIRDYEGSVTVGLFVKKAGVWSRVGALTSSWTANVGNPTPVNTTHEQFWGVTDTIQMGEGIEAFGATVEGFTGPLAGRVVVFDTFGPITWSSPGTSSSTKSALASGAKTSIKITPQG